MKLSDCLSAYAYNLVVKMYDHCLAYNPYDSHAAHLVFDRTDGTSGMRMTFDSWKHVREWLCGVSE